MKIMYRVICDGSVSFSHEERVKCENFIMGTYDRYPNHIDMGIQKQVPITKWVNIK